MRPIPARADPPRLPALCGVVLAAAALLSGTARAAERWDAPRIDLARRAQRGVPDEGPMLAGVPIRAGLSPATAGVWRPRPGGGRVWSLEVRSADALWLGLGFEGFRLPEGASLEVTDAAGRPVAVRGPADARADGQLWLPPADGDTLRIELTWPASQADRMPGLTLTTVTHGFRSWTTGDPRVLAGTTDCNVDVNCSPEGDAWRAERRGVVQMLIMNTGAVCTGSLVNTTANLATEAPPYNLTYPLGMRCAPLVLTADHCYDAPPPDGPPGTAASTVFLFGYEVDPTGACTGGLAPGIAPRSQTSTGATEIAAYDPSDFHLLLMDELPPQEFGAYLNGWNRATAAPTEVTTIHHPANTGATVLEVRPKKITHSSTAPTNGTAFGANHWRVVNWDKGAPEPGSSGAPLFDQNHRIVGQLHGGPTGVGNCDAPTADEFGKLSASWSGGGTTASRLSSHLDPLSTGVTTLDGIDLQTCLTRQPGVVHLSHTVGDDTLTGNRNGIAEPGDTLRLEVELFNGKAVPATGVSATLEPTTSPNVTMIVPSASWSGTIPPLSEAGSDLPHFGLSLSQGMVCGSSPQMRLTVTTDQGSTESLFRLPTGTPAQTFYDDGASGPSGFYCAPGLCVGGDQWTVPAPWTQFCEPSQCPDVSWHVPDTANNTNALLATPTIRTGNLAAGSRLSFRHYMKTQTAFDGGVLEYSTDGGANWLDAYGLIVEGFYDATIEPAGTSGIKGRAAWSGISEGWREVVFDLSPFALVNGVLDIRWRFVTDSGGAVAGGGGWWVDDVEIVGGGFTCQSPASRHFPGSRCLRDDPGQGFPCGQRIPPRSAGPSRHR